MKTINEGASCDNCKYRINELEYNAPITAIMHCQDCMRSGDYQGWDPDNRHNVMYSNMTKFGKQEVVVRRVIERK